RTRGLGAGIANSGCDCQPRLGWGRGHTNRPERMGDAARVAFRNDRARPRCMRGSRKRNQPAVPAKDDLAGAAAWFYCEVSESVIAGTAAGRHRLAPDARVVPGADYRTAAALV